MGPTYEVCTNDMAQAIDWSERQATWQGQYSDLVEVRSDARLFEVARTRIGSSRKGSLRVSE